MPERNKTFYRTLDEMSLFIDSMKEKNSKKSNDYDEDDDLDERTEF